MRRSKLCSGDNDTGALHEYSSGDRDKEGWPCEDKWDFESGRARGGGDAVMGPVLVTHHTSDRWVPHDRRATIIEDGEMKR